VFVVEHTCSC